MVGWLLLRLNIREEETQSITFIICTNLQVVLQFAIAMTKMILKNHDLCNVQLFSNLCSSIWQLFLTSWFLLGRNDYASDYERMRGGTGLYWSDRVRTDSKENKNSTILQHCHTFHTNIFKHFQWTMLLFTFCV